MLGKILLVEDDESISWIYKTKLESAGYGVILAKNGAEGLDLAKTELPNIILLDVIMPQIDGFTALQELKKNESTKNIPVIMLTNLGTDEDKIKGFVLGAIDYIVKANFTPTQIIEKIKQYIK